MTEILLKWVLKLQIIYHPFILVTNRGDNPVRTSDQPHNMHTTDKCFAEHTNTKPYDAHHGDKPFHVHISDKLVTNHLLLAIVCCLNQCAFR